MEPRAARSITAPSTCTPPTRKRVMCRRNNRVPGSMPASRRRDLPDGDRDGDGGVVEGEDKHGARRVVAGALGGIGGIEIGIGGIGPDVRLNRKCSPPLWMCGDLVYVYTDLKPMPNCPIRGMSPHFALWPTPQTPRTSASVKGPPSCRPPAGPRRARKPLGRARVLGLLNQLEDQWVRSL